MMGDAVMVDYWRGFAAGYADGAGGAVPGIRPSDAKMWLLGYMAGYLTAHGIKVGQPNA